MSNYETAPGIRRSDLWVINKSPLHFKYHIEHRQEPTKALLFGAAVHKYILEEDDFFNEYAIAPAADRRTKEGKIAWAEFCCYCDDNGLDAITEDEFEQIQEMAKALEQNDLAVQLLTGEHEKAYFWHDLDTGELCKCKIDCLTNYDGKPYIVDYKTTDSCEDGHFERSARKYGYQFQAGMYREGVFMASGLDCGFAFVAQEKTPPYASRVYICDSEWINAGLDKFKELINIYHMCNISGIFYGYEGPDNVPAELVEVEA